MSNIINNRWLAPENVLAEKIMLNDLPGFVSKKVIINPGDRALLIVGGDYYADLPPNTYIAQNLMQTFGLQQQKPMALVFIRSGQVLLQFDMTNLRTLEGLAVHARFQASMQVSDTAMFFKNLLGSQKMMTIEQLRELLMPIVHQAMWDAVRMESIVDLTSTNAVEKMDAVVARSTRDNFLRYGLRFDDMHAMSIRHERFEANQSRQAEIWIFGEELSQRKKLDQLYTQEELQKIARQEQQNDLEVLALHNSTDRAEGKLAVIKRRIGIRKQWRETILSDRFNSVANAEELSNLLAENDKAKLIRESEMDDLKRTFEENKAERSIMRKFVLQRIEREQAHDLALFDMEKTHELRMKKLECEIALTIVGDDESTRLWRKAIEKDRAEEMVRHENRQRELNSLIKEGEHDREVQWQDALNKKRIEMILGEIEDAKIDRESRRKTLALEYERTQSENQQREQNRAQDLEDRKRKGQLETLQVINTMNDQRRREDRESQERMDRMKAESAQERDDLIYSTQLRQFELMINADVKKHEASEEAAIAKAQAAMHSKETQYEATIREKEASEKKILEIYSKLSDAEREKADLVMQATREMMDGHQKLMSQAIDNMKPVPIHPTINVSTSGQVGMSEGQRSFSTGDAAQTTREESKRRTLLCPKCRAENVETSRYCERCGKHL